MKDLVSLPARNAQGVLVVEKKDLR